MITEISKAQLLALHVGRLKDQERLDHSHVSMLKMNNVWMARETARMARDILGANGIVDDYCVMRHMNNLESVYTYEGTHDIHKLSDWGEDYGDFGVLLRISRRMHRGDRIVPSGAGVPRFARRPTVAGCIG